MQGRRHWKISPLQHCFCYCYEYTSMIVDIDAVFGKLARAVFHISTQNLGGVGAVRMPWNNFGSSGYFLFKFSMTSNPQLQTLSSFNIIVDTANSEDLHHKVHLHSQAARHPLSFRNHVGMKTLHGKDRPSCPPTMRIGISIGLACDPKKSPPQHHPLMLKE